MFVLLCKCQHCGEPMARYPNSEIRAVCANRECGTYRRTINFCCQWPGCHCDEKPKKEQVDEA